MNEYRGMLERMRSGAAAVILCVASCAYAPHFADSGLTGAVIAGGGAELNPIGFPGVVVAKIGMEALALQKKSEGDKRGCFEIASAARMGSWIGTGATAGGLVAGPIGMGFGALVALVAGQDAAIDSAVLTCYGFRISGGRIVQTSEIIGFHDRSE